MMDTGYIPKILALVLVAMMAMGMVSALAAELPYAGGPVVSSDTSLTLNKVMVVKNDLSGVTIAHPQVVYSFELSPKNPNRNTVTAHKTVTTTSGGTTTNTEIEQKVEIQEGPVGGAYIGTQPAADATGDAVKSSANVTLATGTKVMNTNGEEAVIGTLTVNFDINRFSGAGVYRYLLKDVTAATTLTTAGIARGANFEDGYNIDVYVKNKADGTGLEFGGFVLTDEDVTNVNDKEVGSTPATKKESGIEDVTLKEETEGSATVVKLDPTNPVSTTTNDIYYTYNVTLEKLVTGTMGDKSHEFSFDVVVENDGKNDSTTDKLGYSVDKAANEGAATTLTAANQTAAETGSTTVLMKDKDIAHIIGVGPYAKVTYTETNNTTGTYEVTIKDAGDAVVNSIDTAVTQANETQTTGELTLVNTFNTTAESTVSDNGTIKFTNNMDEISPTGLVLRFAPYFAMFAAGVALFIILGIKRRKSEEE